MPTTTTGHHYDIPPNFQVLVQENSLGVSGIAEDGSHEDWYLSANGQVTRHKNHLATMREDNPISIKDAIYWGRQFRDIVRFLPLCPKLRGSFRADDEGEHKQVDWLFWVVDGDYRIFQTRFYSNDAFEAWKRVGDPLGLIYVTGTLDDARTVNEIELVISAMLKESELWVQPRPNSRPSLTVPVWCSKAVFRFKSSVEWLRRVVSVNIIGLNKFRNVVSPKPRVPFQPRPTPRSSSSTLVQYSKAVFRFNSGVECLRTWYSQDFVFLSNPGQTRVPVQLSWSSPVMRCFGLIRVWNDSGEWFL
ncbi:hypothetical protein K438DRAFT_1785451 [Mycena galopus ATCC 62051]|nr:hypothetical protein K438DRAFT_1785451 [Mycena galopus ATCC 62051]